MMKSLLFAVALAGVTLAAPARAALEVFACEPEWGALTKELGAPHVEVYTATHALQDVHRIQPRPSLIARYRQAELLVCTGAELEIGWLPVLAEKGNNPKLNPGMRGYFEAARHVSMLEIPATLDRSAGDVHPYGNPHIQTAPANIAKVARPLADKLAELDPAHAADYRAAWQRFDTRWQAAMARWQEQARPLQGAKVVSAHKSWVYLYQWLGLREVAVLEPKPGIPPSGAQLQAVLESLKAEPAQMIVYAAYQDRRPVDWLAGRSRLPMVELPYSPGGTAGTDDLFGYFDVTIQRLLAGLGGKSA
jgi:zinc/manganese transport system substrate-binding protein